MGKIKIGKLFDFYKDVCALERVVFKRMVEGNKKEEDSKICNQLFKAKIALDRFLGKLEIEVEMTEVLKKEITPIATEIIRLMKEEGIDGNTLIVRKI